MRDMSNLYRVKRTDELKELRSKKAVRLANLQEQCPGFFANREIEALEYQIHRIDVELTARFYQTKMP